MLDNDQLLISLSKKTKLGNLSSSQTKQMKLRTLKTTRFMYILKQSSTNTAKKTKTGGGESHKTRVNSVLHCDDNCNFIIWN